MMILKVKNKEYKVKFGYNSFCDTDLMDRTSDLIMIFHDAKAKDDKDATALGKIKELFNCVRDLLFVGFEKYNKVETKQEIGDILDDWKDEETKEEKRGLFDLFTKLSGELMDEGFFGDLMSRLSEEAEKQPKAPQK